MFSKQKKNHSKKLLAFSSYLLLLALCFYFFGVNVPGTRAQFTANTSNTSTFQSATLFNPNNLTATSTTNSINLTWTATSSSFASGYHIYRATTSGGTYILLTIVNGLNTLSYQDQTVGTGITYYYVVRAYFRSWESIPSNVASATILAAPFVINSVAIYGYNAQGVLTSPGWVNPNGGTYYADASVSDPSATITSVTADLSSLGNGMQAMSLSGSSYATTNQNTGGPTTPYNFSVTAKDNANSTKVKTGTYNIDTTYPGQPGSLKAVAGGAKNTGLIKVTWNNSTAPGPSGIAGYAIGVVYNGSLILVATVQSPLTSYTYSGLPGNSYDFYVATVNNAGTLGFPAGPATSTAP